MDRLSLGTPENVTSQVIGSTGIARQVAVRLFLRDAILDTEQAAGEYRIRVTVGTTYGRKLVEQVGLTIVA